MARVLNQRKDKEGKEFFTLDLNMAEAKAVVNVFSNVGGAPETTNRKYTQEIRDTLVAHGVEWVDNADCGSRGSIEFSRHGFFGE